MGQKTKKMSRLSLQDILHTGTRQLMRGLLNRIEQRADRQATLTRLLATVRKDDLRVVDMLFRDSPLYRHIKLADEFPKVAPFSGAKEVSLVPTTTIATDYLVHRIVENEQAICVALRQLEALNAALVEVDDDRIVTIISDFVASHGHSLTLARKAAFVIGHMSRESVSYRVCAELVNGYGVKGKNYGMMATVDSIGAEFDYLDLKYRFRNYARLGRDASMSQMIAHFCFNPLTNDISALAEHLGSAYQFSLIDAAILLLAHSDEGIVEVDVPRAVIQAWRSLSGSNIDKMVWFKPSNPYSDYWAFRAAPAFLEYGDLRKFRLALEPLFDLPSSYNRSARSPHHTAAFFDGVSGIGDIVPPSGRYSVSAIPDRFDQYNAGLLARSCAVVWVCDRAPDFSTISAEDMALVMGETFNIDRLLSTDVLRKGLDSAVDSFVQLIMQTLLRAQSASTRDNFNFKDIFQHYVRDNHGGDILEFMKRVETLDRKIVQYFVNLLDETMLSQMPFLMESSEAIYETRARLLEWYANVTDDQLTRDKAKQLRLDRKIAAVRGVINETRLNIDSVRFRQWIEQNKLADFSDYVRQSLSNLPPITELLDRSKKETQFLTAHREPTTLALLALVDCYEEFCRNPDYGIASFLGRRIRHGTLRGTLLNALPNSADLDLPQMSSAQYEAWARTFSESIDALASRLYFSSKNANRDGLLSAQIDEEAKWSLCLVTLTRIYAQAQYDHGIMFVPGLIEQFCWLVFEIELAKVQSFIADARSSWGTLKLRHAYSDDAIAAFERGTNIAVGDQFNTVVSWFRKPPNISPIAELSHVIQVVIQEAKDEYATFSPSVSITENSALELSGQTYYVIYDTLTIAVRNAAKHGSHPGNIEIGTSIDDVGAAKTLKITVISDLRPGDFADAALARIENAGQAGATGADVVEGLSGFRKLKKMEAERSIVGFETSAVPDRTDLLRVAIIVPFRGLVA